jgi:dTMP kinase
VAGGATATCGNTPGAATFPPPQSARSPAPGRFITIEGNEGAGKSTQTRAVERAVALRLAEAGGRVLLTREPGGTAGAEKLRGLLLAPDADWSLPAEILLHFAARADHVEKVIRPALARGDWVICDRFYDSTMVYQAYGQGGDRAMIAGLVNMLGLRPDLTIILDLDVETSLGRLRARGAPSDRYEQLGRPFFERIRDGFLAVAAAEPDRCVVIDATADVETVTQDVLAALRSRLGAG